MGLNIDEQALSGVAGHELSVKTNRHPQTNRELWGWIEAKIPTITGSCYRWTYREVGTWSGRDGERQAEEFVAEWERQRRAEAEQRGGE